LNSKSIKDIIVCDNSNFDYSKCIGSEVIPDSKSIEFLCFLGDKDQISTKGKGYGEGEIVAYALKNSKLIQKGTKSFCKVTGRILLMNIDSILKSVNEDTNYFQRIGMSPFNHLEKVDTKFYHCTIDTFLTCLVNANKMVNDYEGYYLEHVYFHQLKTKKVFYRTFKILPYFIGVSGSTGISYTIKKDYKWYFLKCTYYIVNALNLY